MRNWRADVAARIEGMRLRPEREAEILDEVSQHLEDRYTELKLDGASEDAAIAGALEELEELPVLRQKLDSLRLPVPATSASGAPQQSWLAALVHDVRMAMRAIRHAKGYATLTVLVLAFGIGLNVALFALAGRPLLASRPVPDSSTLVYLYPSREPQLKRPSLQDFRLATSALLTDVAKFSDSLEVVTTNTSSVRRPGESVSANYFTVLGLTPARGRTFAAHEDDPFNQDRGIVISHTLWQEQFGGVDDVLGRTVELGTRRYTVIGVMPEGFKGISAPFAPADYWVTIAQQFAEPSAELARALEIVGTPMVARLQGGVTVPQAQAALSRGIAIGVSQLPVRTVAADSIFIARSPDTGQRAIWLSAGAALVLGAIVLIIAVANVSGLAAARSIARHSEVAIRQALGASTTRVARERLLEFVVLAVPAGVMGVLLALAALQLYRAYPPSTMVLDSTVDAQVIVFAILLALAVSLIAGIGPAKRAWRIRLHDSLGHAHMSLSKRERQRLAYGVLAPQIILSTALVFAGAAYVTNVLNMGMPDPGYKVDGVVLVTVDMPSATATDRPTLQRDIETSLSASLTRVPGFQTMSLSTRTPTDHSHQVFTRFIDDTQQSGDQGVLAAWGGSVTPGHFEGLGIRLVAGRTFNAHDAPETPAVAVVTESFVHKMWPDGAWRGRRVSLTTGAPVWREVVGIVADTRSSLQTTEERPLVYSSLGQGTSPMGFPVTAVVTLRGEAQRQLGAIVSALRTDTRVRIRDARTVRDEIERDRYPVRATMWLLSTVGMVGGLAVGIGLFGILSFTVAQRMPEWGIRAALGATPQHLQWLVGRTALRFLLLAGVPGLLVGYGAMRTLASFVRSAPQTPTMAVGVVVAAVVTLIVLAAAWLPAQRAGAVDPLRVLRRN